MSNTNYFAYARHALVAGLRHLNVGDGDEVGVPELICRDVLAAVHAVGAKPQFYPVGTDLRPIDQGPAKQARAVLMVNYFGFPQDTSQFAKLWPSASIIEDNAHGYLSKDSDGNLLGSRTNVGITSFRKTLLVPDGAFLSTVSPIHTSLAVASVARDPNLAFKMRTLVSHLERRSNLPFQRFVRSMTRQLRLLQTGSALPKSNSIAEVEMPQPVAISQYSLKRLASLDSTREILRRRDLFQLFLEASISSSIHPIFPRLPDGCSPYGFVFLASELPTSFIRAVHHNHCEIISWPDLPDAITVSADHFYRNLKVVNFL